MSRAVSHASRWYQAEGPRRKTTARSALAAVITKSRGAGRVTRLISAHDVAASMSAKLGATWPEQTVHSRNRNAAILAGQGHPMAGDRYVKLVIVAMALHAAVSACGGRVDPADEDESVRDESGGSGGTGS